MAEYIEREAAFKELMGRILITGYGGLTAYDVKLCFSNLKNADVRPAVRGTWERKPDPFGFFDDIPVCSNCGCTTKWRETYLFCPNCGADMREERKNA